VVPEEVYKTGKNGQIRQIGQKRTKTAKTHKNFSMHEIAGFGINQNHVITLKNFCD
jgi:hypothetical protein